MNGKLQVKVVSALLVICLFFVNNLYAAMPVQATLTKEDETWVIRSVAMDGGNVNLVTGRWLGPEKMAGCRRGIFGITQGGCEDNDIYSSTPNGSNIAVPFVWPFALVSGVTLSLFGKFHDVLFFPIYVNRKFSEPNFRAALTSAVERDGGQKRLTGILNDISRLDDEARKADSELSVSREELKRYSTEMLVLAENTLRLKVVDKSGFWSGENIVPAAGSVQFQLADLDVPAFATSVTSAQTPCLKVVKQALFPANNLSEFANKIPIAATQLEEAKSNNFSQLAKLRNTIEQRNAAIQMYHTNQLTSRLQRDGFVVEISLPESMQITGGVVTAGAEGTLLVSSRNFQNILPQSFNYANSDIALALDGNSIKITNKSKTYLSLDALTLYHDEDVLTLGSENLREISPNTIISISLDRLNLKALNKDYPNMTREQARATRINFGFACKYRRNDLTQARSFVEIKSYNLIDVLNQLDLIAKR